MKKKKEIQSYYKYKIRRKMKIKGKGEGSYCIKKGRIDELYKEYLIEIHYHLHKQVNMAQLYALWDVKTKSSEGNQ